MGHGDARHDAEKKQKSCGHVLAGVLEMDGGGVPQPSERACDDEGESEFHKKKRAR
jgi:hypothetical protein